MLVFGVHKLDHDQLARFGRAEREICTVNAAGKTQVMVHSTGMALYVVKEGWAKFRTQHANIGLGAGEPFAVNAVLVNAGLEHWFEVDPGAVSIELTKDDQYDILVGPSLVGS